MIALLPDALNRDDYDITEKHFYLLFDDVDDYIWWVSTKKHLKGKQELTYTQFLEMIGGETSAESDQNGSPLTYWGGKAISKEVLQGENYTREDMEKAYRSGEKGATYYFKDTTVILPTTYEGVDG